MRRLVPLICVAVLAGGPPAGATAPTSLTAPQTSGRPVVGATLTTTDGTWSGTPTAFSYRWWRCVPVTTVSCAPAEITGADASLYVLTLADVGATVYPVVRAGNAAGEWSAGRAGAGVGPVVAVAPLENVTRPELTGRAMVGWELTVSTGAWSRTPTGYAFRWRRCTLTDILSCPVGIAGETGATYILTEEDVGWWIMGEVAATEGSGFTTFVSSRSAIGPVAAAPDEVPIGEGPGTGGEDEPPVNGSGQQPVRYDPAVLRLTTARPVAVRAGKKLIVRPGIRLVCPAHSTGCFGTVTAKITATGRRVARARVVVGPAGSRIVAFALDAVGVKALRRSPRLRLTVALVVTGERTDTVRLTRRITVRRPR